MASFYDEIELEDFEFDEEAEVYSYPCPCGDKFLISLVSFLCHLSVCLAYIFARQQDELRNGEEIARCPSCSLLLRVVYDPDEFLDSDSEGEAIDLLAVSLSTVQVWPSTLTEAPG